MECDSCGAKNLPNAVACVNCGDSLEAEPIQDGSLIGKMIAGRYELLEVIGEGSMGCVYSAHQEDLDRDVAVKILHPHVAADPKVAKRFHREAKLASKLSHPNTVRVFDFGRDESDSSIGKILYITMELLDGPDLLDVIRTELPLTPKRAVGLTVGALAALEEAHEIGVIHRDLKPENIVVVRDHEGEDVVKVCDFGIAKLVEADGSAITVTGFVCGTPEYMAPEQARGEDLDGRADVYAIGCVLYQLLTGEMPFSGPSALATITQHLTEPVERPNRRCEWHLPYVLEKICMKALSKDRDRRYRSAREMREALEEALELLQEIEDTPFGESRRDPSLPPRRSANISPWWLLAAGLALLVGVAWMGARSDESPDPLENESRVIAAVQDAGAPDTSVDAASDTGSDATVDSSNEQDSSLPESDAARPIEEASASEAEMPSVMRTRRERSRADSAATLRVERTPPDSAMESVMTPSAGAFEEGRRLFLAGDLRGAIASFERAARARPSDPRIQKELGRAYLRFGNRNAGRRAYRRYLELAPNAPDRAVIERMIE